MVSINSHGKVSVDFNDVTLCCINIKDDLKSDKKYVKKTKPINDVDLETEKEEVLSKPLEVSKEEVKNNNIESKLILKPKDTVKVNETSKNASEKLENNFLDKVLIGTGRAFVKTGQGIKQLSLGVGEKLNIVKDGTTTAYTKKINQETKLYENTLVGKSTAAKVGEILTDIGTAVVIPGGAGATGTKIIIGSAGAGALISGVQATKDGSLTSRAKNATVGAVTGAAGGYVFSKTAQGFHWVWKEGKIKHGLRNFDSKGRARNNFNISKKLSSQCGVNGPSHNVNAQINLNKKMRALEKAKITAVKTENLPDGRVRYYEAERASKKQGSTRGASFVTEYNPKTGQVRSWNECYDHNGKVNRVHPKTIDGQDLHGQHYPPTKLELDAFSNFKSKGPKP